MFSKGVCLIQTSLPVFLLLLRLVTIFHDLRVRNSFHSFSYNIFEVFIRLDVLRNLPLQALVTALL